MKGAIGYDLRIYRAATWRLVRATRNDSGSGFCSFFSLGQAILSETGCTEVNPGPDNMVEAVHQEKWAKIVEEDRKCIKYINKE